MGSFELKAGEGKNEGDGPDRSGGNNGGGIGNKLEDTTDGSRTANVAGKVAVAVAASVIARLIAPWRPAQPACQADQTVRGTSLRSLWR